MSVDNEYAWWLTKLAGDPVKFHEDEPHSGRFRLKPYGDKPWLPVALWWDGERDENDELTEDATLVCLVGFAHNAHRDDPYKLWTRIADYVVTGDEYKTAFETGYWPDDPPRVRGSIGDNLPEDPHSAILAELEGEAEIVAEFLRQPVESQEQADKIGPWTKRLIGIRQRADKLHDEEKAPHLAAGQAVDDKWRRPRAWSTELVAMLRDHLQPHLIKQKREEQERARAAAAEAARLRGEAAGKLSDAERTDLLRQASDQEQKAVPQKVSAGRTGAKVTLRKERRARVTDYKVAANALLDLDGPISIDLKTTIDQLAQRVVRGGLTPPGVEVEELEVAR